MFWFVSLTFDRRIKDSHMFLSEVWIREYMHEREQPVKDLAGDVHLVFSEDGDLNVTSRTISRKPEVRFETEEWEANPRVNVSQNWLPEPEFGNYEALYDFEDIIKPGDLLATAPDRKST